MAALPDASSDLARIMGPVARDLLGDPTEEHRDELRFGSRGSLCVDLSKGSWFDHQAAEGGGVIALVMRERRTDKPGAMTWLRDRGHLPKAEPKLRATIVATYDYTDADGTLLFQVCRMDPKDFRQRRPDGPGKWIWKMVGVQRVIYRLPDVLIAVAEGRTVYITEGEKAADRLAGLGLTATCSPGGANKWRPEYAPMLAGADVVILPDNDEPGRSHAASVAKSLRGLHGQVARLRVLELPGLAEKQDVFDWIAAGGTAEELERLASDAPEPKPETEAAIESPPDSFDGVLTEHTCAVAFAAEFKDRLRYCHHTGAWYVWSGTHWKKNETKLAFSWARQLVARLNAGEDLKVRVTTGRAAFAAAVERYCQADPVFAVTSETWDADPFLLGTPGGTVDLRTGELRGARQEDFITKLTAVAPADVPECPLWTAFLNQAMGGDQAMIRFLRQWFGYSLSGDTREQSLTFFHGPGENGKGVTVNTMAGIMGAYARNAPMDTFQASYGERHPTELAMLRGARMVTASETEEGRAWAEARIKTLTGGDTITARFMRQDFFEYLPQFKLTFMGNHKPVLKNVDHAAKRRFKMIPYLYRPPIKDVRLFEKLKAEWPAILRWAIEGCLDWQMNGLIVPQGVVESTNQYFAEQDTLSQWLEDCCEVHPALGDTHVSLWGSWSNYAKQHGDDPGGSKGFSQALLKRGFRQIKNTNGIRGRGIGGLQVRHYVGAENAA